jgi:hypothetical protein
MLFSGHSSNPKAAFFGFWVAIGMLTIAPSPSQADENGFNGPSFRKGMWHFVRTLELVLGKNNRQRLMEREVTRCVDPTHAMKATFSSPSVGNCISAKPQRADNKYMFANRCDYMGPVSTVITVHSDESYTEFNALNVGQMPRTELVVAHRVGDCQEDQAVPGRSPDISH